MDIGLIFYVNFNDFDLEKKIMEKWFKRVVGIL